MRTLPKPPSLGHKAGGFVIAAAGTMVGSVDNRVLAVYSRTPHRPILYTAFAMGVVSPPGTFGLSVSKSGELNLLGSEPADCRASRPDGHVLGALTVRFDIVQA